MQRLVLSSRESRRPVVPLLLLAARRPGFLIFTWEGAVEETRIRTNGVLFSTDTIGGSITWNATVVMGQL